VHGKEVTSFGLHFQREALAVRDLREREAAHARRELVRGVVLTNANGTLEGDPEGVFEGHGSLATNVDALVVRDKLVDERT
jgi:hypothetical protein